jgi:FtsP/CotA-like multicopper oxidase with cupredoxin domain
MWRIVNTSGRAGAFFAAPPAGIQWRRLAQDGVQFYDSNYQQSLNKSFLMAAGNRVDLLVKAPATPCANPQGCMYPVLVQNEVDPANRATASKLTLLSIRVMGAPLDPKSHGANFIPKAPTFPAFLDDITNDEIKGTKKIVFASTPPGNPPATPAMHTIDGKKFDGEVGALVQLNKAEEWKIVNETYGPPISHPFHIHINPFQIVEVFDPNATLPDPLHPGKTIPQYIFDQKDRQAKTQCYLDPFAKNHDDWKPCTLPPVQSHLIWWDVFPIPSGRTVTTTKKDQNGNAIKVNVPGYFKMRSRFVDYSGYYVLHCHILAHEDRGMMTVVEVSPARPPYSHN